MKKILFTGGSGFIGTRFKDFVKDQYIVLNPSSKELDVRDFTAINNYFDVHQPDYVIHGAAITSTQLCEENKELAYEVNVLGSKNIAECCKEYGIELVFLSTEQVFNGNEEEGPYSEETLPSPNTYYGTTKLEAEKAIAETLDNFWILRLTWLFGMPERGLKINPNILWSTIHDQLKGNVMNVSDMEYRGLTYVYEFIENLTKVFDLPHGLYHFGSENPFSRYQNVIQVLEKIGVNPAITTVQKIHKSRDIRLSMEKINENGIFFLESPDAIDRALKEYSFL
ncbi:SDR family oxidoreductase [Sediminitomix flava]|uniref:dTDP-4-dehydrorhamnose reductase n=1 Tax=Sediminitomix flava TaxID=379075 RepID=A0A315Z4P7_SEDFL|nr:sugar nucleotide-binding protein [Sediminitomix flava]PWJ38453.1 dTDP-4-dehydrorhamnose reductase [Sediminitomix flava]